MLPPKKIELFTIFKKTLTIHEEIFVRNILQITIGNSFLSEEILLSQTLKNKISLS